MKNKFLLYSALLLSSFMPLNKIQSEKTFYSSFVMNEQLEAIKSLEPLVKSIKYTSDSVQNEYDYWQSPKETLEKMTGDCEDKAILVNDSLKKMGIETKLCFGKRRKSSVLNHFWVEFGDYIIESSKVIEIYRRDSLDKMNSEIIYKKINSEYPKIKVKEYEKRNGVKLDFKEE